MAQSEVIARLDLIDQRLERWEGDRDRSLRENVELRAFLDELLRRHAVITQDWVAALAALQAETIDGREQLRANTQAVLRLLDERFGPEPPQG